MHDGLRDSEECCLLETTENSGESCRCATEGVVEAECLAPRVDAGHHAEVMVEGSTTSNKTLERVPEPYVCNKSVSSNRHAELLRDQKAITVC
jgi:hypothetical protein